MKDKIIEIETLQKELNQIKFHSMENILCGDILHYILRDILGKPLKIQTKVKSVLKKVIYMFYHRSYKVEVFGTPKTIALFSEFGRPDHEKAFHAVTGLLCDYATITVGEKFVFDPLGIKYMKNIVKWNTQIKKVVPDFFERMILLNYLFEAYIFYKYYEKLYQKYHWNIKNLITYCDVKFIDSCLTQIFNLQQKNTITLQHGFFSYKTDAWAYLGSKSNYFLAHSTAVVEVANNIGYGGTMLPVGSLHLMRQKEYAMPENFAADNIGVIMNNDGMSPIEDNIRMLKVVQEYCQVHHKKMILRYHPQNSPKEYEKYIDPTVTTICEAKSSVEEFGNQIDVAVVSASTVFTAMLQQWIPTFLFVRKGHDPELFPKTDSLKFSTASELELRLHWKDDKKMAEELKQLREFFLTSGKIEDNYRKAFQEIGVL